MNTHRRSRTRRRGLTVAELMLAMAGTSLVGLAVSAMVFATDRGSDEEKSVRSLVVESKVVSSRINAALRSCRRVLDVSSTRVILWTSDTDNDGLVDASEVGVIDHDPATTQLTYATVASGIATEWDPATTSFVTPILALQAANNLDATVWSNRVVTATFTTNNPADHISAALIAYQIEIAHAQLTEVTTHSVALRNRSQN
ncbi:MAG: hypothetical protein AAF823_12705 [Planctomycetota bacterium]